MSAGSVCLQGGAELQPGCEQMDTTMLAGQDDVPRRVLVVPFAGRPGREREVAGQNADRWYRGLGAVAVDVVLTDEALADALGALGGGDLLVLPGGSPTRLLTSLQPHAAVLRAALDAGTAISGASAGAMVLCRWTVLPDDGRRVAAALGLAPVDLVLPHYDGATRGWLDDPALPPDALVLGLPERSGVVIDPAGSRRTSGVSPVVRLR